MRNLYCIKQYFLGEEGGEVGSDDRLMKGQ